MADMSTVGVLGGTGPQGRGLTMRLALAGYRCVIGSRDPLRAATIAAGLREDHAVHSDLLDGAGNDAAAAAEIVVVAVPFDGVAATVESLADSLAGKVVVSCVNRLAFDDSGPRPVPVDAGSAAELIAELVPQARVVGAFHHVPAGRLGRSSASLDMDVLITGDDDAACETVREMADAIAGVRGVRAGPLRLTRPLEELTAVVLTVNRRYKVAAGIRLAGLDQ